MKGRYAMIKILYAASEALPYAASGGLADVLGSLPAAVAKTGCDCRVVLPLYKSIKPELRAELEFITNFTVDVGWRKQYCGVFKGSVNGLEYYLLDNEYYFGRNGLYGFYDDCERFVYFSRAILEMLKYIDWMPDIINCNDWQTALVPVYYEIFYKFQFGYENIKTALRTSRLYSRYTISSIRASMGWMSSMMLWASRCITQGCSNMTAASI